MGTDSQRTSWTTRLGVALAIVTASASVGVGTASAAGRTDPHANSPAGTIYQIPLDSGRSDAAPSRKSGKGGSGSRGGTGSASGSAGSGTAAASGSGAANGGSGTAGGASASGAAANTSTAAKDDAPGGGTSSDPSPVHSENGFGSSDHVPGVSNAGVPTLANASVADRGGSSDLTTYLFIAAIGIVALACGVGVAGRIRR